MEPSKFDAQGQRNRSLSVTASSLDPQKQRIRRANKGADGIHLHDGSVLSNHDERHVMDLGN